MWLRGQVAWLTGPALSLPLALAVTWRGHCVTTWHRQSSGGDRRLSTLSLLGPLGLCPCGPPRRAGRGGAAGVTPKRTGGPDDGAVGIPGLWRPEGRRPVERLLCSLGLDTPHSGGGVACRLGPSGRMLSPHRPPLLPRGTWGSGLVESGLQTHSVRPGRRFPAGQRGGQLAGPPLVTGPRGPGLQSRVPRLVLAAPLRPLGVGTGGRQVFKEGLDF